MPRIITQRELRNNSAAVMDAVEGGETVVVTRNGHAVAELRPLKGRVLPPTVEVLRAFRGLPRLSYDKMRAESDALWGEDRIGG
jgi:prevent-host-death family protein